MLRVFKLADPWLVFTLISMLMLGLLAVMSAGIHLNKDPFFYALRQIVFILMGIPFFFLGAFLNYQSYRFRTYLPFLLGISLLILVILFGEQSWLSLGFGFHLQPSEFAKVIIIMYLSYMLSFDRGGTIRFLHDFLPMAAVCGMLIGAVILLPDFGSAAIMILITGYMLFIGGIPMKFFTLPALIFTPFAVILPFKYSYVGRRFTDYFDVLKPGVDPSSLGFHVLQFHLGIGSGGWFGTGYAQGLIKRSFLPASHTDSIYAVLTEELGFVAGAIVILLFLWLLILGERTARFTLDRFGALLARGIVFYICAQAFLNVCVCLSLIPNTGVTLPFFSYGGSSLIITMYAYGILVNISSQRQLVLS